MVIAASTYTQIYDGYYPIAHYSQTTNSEVIGYNWDFTTIKKLGASEMEVVPGLLWQGQTIEKIQQCPSFKGNSETSSNPFSGYNYNTSYIGHGEEEHVSAGYSGEIRRTMVELMPGVLIEKKIIMPIKIDRVKRPGMCALFGDGGFGDDVNKFMRAPWQWDGDTDNSLKAAGTQAYRHANLTNVAWCDGHADSQKDLYTETTLQEKVKVDIYNENDKYSKVGFLSPDNSAYDLK